MRPLGDRLQRGGRQQTVGLSRGASAHRDAAVSQGGRSLGRIHGSPLELDSWDEGGFRIIAATLNQRRHVREAHAVAGVDPHRAVGQPIEPPNAAAVERRQKKQRRVLA